MDPFPPRIFTAIVAGEVREMKSDDFPNGFGAAGIAPVFIVDSPAEFNQIMEIDVGFLVGISWWEWEGDVTLTVVHRTPLGHASEIIRESFRLPMAGWSLLKGYDWHLDGFDGLHWLEFLLDGTLCAQVPLKVLYRERLGEVAPDDRVLS